MKKRTLNALKACRVAAVERWGHLQRTISLKVKDGASARATTARSRSAMHVIRG